MHAPDTAPTSATARGPLALLLTILGALARLLPHPPNFAPVGAASLFSGATLPAWQAYLVPLAVMVVTDPILAVYYGVHAFTAFQIFIYGSLLINVWIGRRLVGSRSVARIGAAAFLCALQFFAVTNFAVWLTSTQYPATATGLLACYAAGIPFFGWTLAGDLVYSAVLFGLYAWLSRVAPFRKVPAAA